MFSKVRVAGLMVWLLAVASTFSWAIEKKQVKTKLEKAAFATGCFWCAQDAFEKLPGISSTVVGYMGGHTKNPSYQEVHTGRTGHAETILIYYDPSKISYKKLLQAFWNMHDPTTLNRQGPNIGSQYRSVIFYFNPEQHREALASKEALQRSGQYKHPIVTEIVPATTFYKAEEEHQHYYEKHRVTY